MKFNLQKKVDLSRFHTFGTRQIAKYLIQVNDLEDLDSALDFALKAEVPFLILGEGSNTLFKSDFSGCLLYTSPSPRDRQKSRMPSSA